MYITLASEVSQEVWYSYNLDMLRVVFEYGDQNMNTRTKIKMGKSLKKIQADVESAQKEVLTEEQMTALAAYKEEQKQES